MLGDDYKPLSGWRALRSPEFWLHCGRCWRRCRVVVPLLVAGLSISSLPKYLALRPRARRVGGEGAWWRTIALSALNSLVAACGAFVLGVVAGWL